MNELMKVTDEGQLFDVSSARETYSSLAPKTQEERISYFNSINSPQKRLKECINMDVEIQHVYAETINFIDQETGESTPGVRMVLISPDGTSYQASSKGVYSSLEKLFRVMGTPDQWKKPVKIRPKEVVKGPNRNVLVFELVG